MGIAPGNGPAGGDASRLRASDSDRERAVDVLKSAFVEGRLTKDEYDDRMSMIFASRTYAELSALTSDLPVGPFGAVLPAAQPMYVPATSRNSMAIASLVLGCCQLVTGGMTAIPAVVCGHVARRQIRRTGESGSGMATAGLVLGWLGVTLWTLLVVVGVVAFAVAAAHSP